MCGRYYIDDEVDDEQLLEILREVERKIDSLQDDFAIKLKGEIFPTDTVPIIANNKSMQPTPFAMKWGYSPFKEGGSPIINSRSETASEKRMFKDGMQNRRCLIPATNYYEWQKTANGKVKHAIKPVNSKALYMAGIYRLEHGKEPVFSILTREPAPDIVFIHNRMPVILPNEAHKDWFNINNNADEVIKAAVTQMEYEAV